MKVEEIIALLNAGYTKEEIEAFGTETPETEPVKEPEQNKEPEQKEPEKPTENNAKIEALINQNNELLKQLKEMQNENARSARQPDQQPMSAESVIKSFIENM